MKFKNIIQDYKIILICLSILIGSTIISVAIFYTPKQTQNISYDPSSYIDKTSIQEIKSISDNKDKKVIALIFSDTECIFCKKFQTETMDKLLEKYKDQVTFKYVFLPFRGENSIKYALNIQCAEQQSQNDYQKYYNYIKYFFEVHNPNQNLDKLALEQISNKAELQYEAINDCEKKISKDKLEKLYSLAVEHEVNSTPQIFILKQDDNHKEDYFIYSKIIGARDIKYFEKVIEKSLQ